MLRTLNQISRQTGVPQHELLRLPTFDLNLLALCAQVAADDLEHMTRRINNRKGMVFPTIPLGR